MWKEQVVAVAAVTVVKWVVVVEGIMLLGRLALQILEVEAAALLTTDQEISLVVLVVLV